jgi:hypothetical protein
MTENSRSLRLEGTLALALALGGIAFLNGERRYYILHF